MEKHEARFEEQKTQKEQFDKQRLEMEAKWKAW